MIISKTTVDQVRNIDVLEVVRKYITVKTRGNTHTAPCPFHSEKTASFTVNQRRGIFKCFGCGAAGGPVDFVMQYNRLSFPDAVKELAQSYGIPIDYDNVTPEQQAEYEREYKERKSIHIVLEYACRFFESNDIPKEFMKHRRIKEDAVKKFRIGFAPPGKDNFLKFATAGGHEPEMLEKAGLIRKAEKTGKYYDVFQNRIMFPITNPRGEVVAFSGRLNE